MEIQNTHSLEYPFDRSIDVFFTICFIDSAFRLLVCWNHFGFIRLASQVAIATLRDSTRAILLVQRSKDGALRDSSGPRKFQDNLASYSHAIAEAQIRTGFLEPPDQFGCPRCWNASLDTFPGSFEAP